RDEARALMRAKNLTSAPLRYYIRERVVALLVWNKITGGDLDAREPDDYSSQVQALLGQHFPIYTTSSFPGALAMSRVFLPPLPVNGECVSERPREAMLFFSGVVRPNPTATHEPRDFLAQRSALAKRLPCLETVVVNTGNFLPADKNAEAGNRA